MQQAKHLSDAAVGCLLGALVLGQSRPYFFHTTDLIQLIHKLI